MTSHYVVEIKIVGESAADALATSKRTENFLEGKRNLSKGTIKARTAVDFMEIQSVHGYHSGLLLQVVLFVRHEVIFRGTVAECFERARKLARCDWIVQEWTASGWVPVDRPQ